MLPPLFTAGSHQTASVSTAIGILSLKSFCCSSQFFTYPQQYFNVVNGCHSAAAYLPYNISEVFGAELREVFAGTASVPLTGRQLSVVQLFCYFFPSQPLPHFYVSCGCQKDSVFLPYFHNFDIILIIISGFSFVKTAFRCSPGSCGFSFPFYY